MRGVRRCRVTLQSAHSLIGMCGYLCPVRSAAGPGVGADALAAPDLDVVHRWPAGLRGGRRAGDWLAVEILGIGPGQYGGTVQLPGFGFVRDEFPGPVKVDWDIAHGWATPGDLPGVRSTGSPFMGTIGLSPGHELLARPSPGSGVRLAVFAVATPSLGPQHHKPAISYPPGKCGGLR
jgi:acetamidase/formamidase